MLRKDIEEYALKVMSSCPICQETNDEGVHHCKYCGAVLSKRMHQVPSKPAPALVTRPKQGYDLLMINESNLATLNEEPFEDQAHFTLEGEPSEGGVLTIDEPLEDEIVQISTSIPPPSPLNRSEDGIKAVSLSKVIPEARLFPDEPGLGNDRPKAKLSDLSGVSSLDDLNPRADSHYRLQTESALSSSKLSALADLGSQESAYRDDRSRAEKVLALAAQVTLFFIITLAVSWGLGLSEHINLTHLTEPNKRTIKTSQSPETADETQSLTDQGQSTQKNQEVDPDEIVFEVTSKNADQDQKVSLDQNPNVQVSKADHPGSKELIPPKETKDPASSQAPKQRKRSRASSSTIGFKQLMKQGESNLMRGSVSRARRLFERAHKLKPKSPAPLAQLGWCELAHKRTSNAISQFKRALSLNANHADSLYGLGYAFEKIGNLSGATQYFNRYLELYPSGSKVGVIKNKMRRFKR